MVVCHLRDLPHKLSIINRAAGIFLVKLSLDSYFSIYVEPIWYSGMNKGRQLSIYAVLDLNHRICMLFSVSHQPTSPDIVKTVLHRANSLENQLTGNWSIASTSVFTTIFVQSVVGLCYLMLSSTAISGCGWDLGSY